jgi:hypothetical protein
MTTSTAEASITERQLGRVAKLLADHGVELWSGNTLADYLYTSLRYAMGQAGTARHDVEVIASRIAEPAASGNDVVADDVIGLAAKLADARRDYKEARTMIAHTLLYLSVLPDRYSHDAQAAADLHAALRDAVWSPYETPLPTWG